MTGSRPDCSPLALQEFQKALGSKHSVYDTTSRTGRALKDKTSLQDDRQRLDDTLSELRDKWDTVCGKSVERYVLLQGGRGVMGRMEEEGWRSRDRYLEVIGLPGVRNTFRSWQETHTLVSHSKGMKSLKKKLVTQMLVHHPDVNDHSHVIESL